MQRLHSSEIDFAEKLSKDDKVSQRKMLEKFLQRDTVRINELSEPLLNLANSFTSMVDCFKPAKETAISTARSEDKMHHQYSEALPATMIVVGLGLSICAGTSLAMLVPGVLCALVGFAWLMLKGTADQAPAYEGCSSFGQTN